MPQKSIRRLNVWMRWLNRKPAWVRWGIAPWITPLFVPAYFYGFAPRTSTLCAAILVVVYTALCASGLLDLAHVLYRLIGAIAVLYVGLVVSAYFGLIQERFGAGSG